MSDENPRSTHGLPPDPRSINNPPAWWGSLGRHDLPDDQGQHGRERNREARWLVDEPGGREGPADVPGLRRPRPAQGRAWLIISLTVLVAVVLAVLAASPRGAIAVALLVGLAAAASAVVAVRRRGRP